MEKLVMNNLIAEFYKDKKILLTGHTGFKGAWFTAWLKELGATVYGYALQPEYEQGIFQLIQSTKWNADKSIIADIRDRQVLRNLGNDFQPDLIFHLAAQPLVRRSYTIPTETFDVNVTGTANLLEAVSSLEKKCTVVIVTTDKVYENRERGELYKETDILGGYDPYSASKACTEIVVSSFRNSFFHPSKIQQHQKALASARAGNVIGGGDWSNDRIVPDIVRALQQQQVINVRNPLSIRPWQHVLEPLCGYLLLGMLADQQPGAFGKAFNFGPKANDHLTVKELVEAAISNWGSGEWLDQSDATQPHEAALLQLDINLAQQELQWIPKLNAAQAVQWTIDWYKQPAETKLDFTIQQIKTYMTL